MHVDNIFLVESPFQALVALELSLKFSDKQNGIFYRLSGTGREKSDEQIYKVIEKGQWAFARSISFDKQGALARQWNLRKFILNIRKEFNSIVCNVFFGAFHAQWMHLVRLAAAPERSVLMDDGAATLAAKKNYIDHDIFYPQETSFSRKTIKNILHYGLFDKKEKQKPLYYASVFMKNESRYKVDFSFIRMKLSDRTTNKTKILEDAYFFGSPYSEAKILTLKYELDFISRIVTYYKKKGMRLIYCSHRGDSNEKLNLINSIDNAFVVSPDVPAEIFILECQKEVAEISAAYSSVINNMNIIFPDKVITSFRLDFEKILPRKIRGIEVRDIIEEVYNYYESEGIKIENDF